MTQGHNPVAQRRRLRAELRRARDRMKMTQKEVAEALDWSPSKVIRIETGAVRISTTDLHALLQHYGVTDESKVEELVEAARASRKRAWWDEYRQNFDPALIAFIAVEASASLVRQFQALVIPGLLQTPDYARSVVGAYTPEADHHRTDRAVDLRMQRHNLLEREEASEAFFILDEAAIRRSVGSPEIMRAQLEYLKELNRRSNITIQVVTFDRGAHPAMQASFVIFEFPDEAEDHVVYLEQPGQNVLIRNDVAEVSRYVEYFVRLEEVATAPDELDAVIARILADLENGDDK